MQSFREGFRLLRRSNLKFLNSALVGGCESRCLISAGVSFNGLDSSLNGWSKIVNLSTLIRGFSSLKMEMRLSSPNELNMTHRSMSTAAQLVSHDYAAPAPDVVPTRIKFKRLDKTAKHIMQILDREAVSEVQAQREIPEIRPGYVIQLKMEVPENKRRVQVVKGIVIARRNAGLNTTFRLRRLVGGVGVESLFPLYSPNIREIKVLEKKKVRRAKLYYLRDKMNALRK